MSVNFEVTDAMGTILSLEKGADTGAMTILKLDAGGRITNDAAPMEIIPKKHDETTSFDIVDESCAHVLDEKSSGVGFDRAGV